MWRLSRSIPVAVVVAIVAIVAAIIAITYFGDLTVSRRASVTDIVQSAIAAFTVIAALVGAVFLYRRSRISLADSRRADEEQYQRRFVDASNLMGNENAAVRVAGVIAMGTLARDWSEQRQRCVDVLCGYMRVPPDGWHWGRDDGESPPTIHDRGENEVRNTLCQELQKLLSDPAVVKAPAARAIDIDLHGAVFGDFTSFRKASFRRHVSFDGAQFTGTCDFSGVVFSGLAEFRNSRFHKEADFTGATFEGRAHFGGCVFNSEATLTEVRFLSYSNRKDVDFTGTSFGSRADFVQAYFVGNADFSRTYFAVHPEFWNARFGLLVLANEPSQSMTDCPAEWLMDDIGPRAWLARATSVVEVQRLPLGPLARGSKVPHSPGDLVDEEGIALRQAEWTVGVQEE